MTNRDKDRFARIVTALAETFDKTLSEAVIGVYFDALKDLPIDAIEKAAGVCVRTAKFMPRPAELREHAGGAPGSLQDRSLLAWATVNRAIGRIGAYRSVTIYDPATAAAIEALGGWPALCLNEQETHWIERDFRKYYELYANQVLDSSEPKQLPGIHETQNGDAVPASRMALDAPRQLRALPGGTA